MLEVHFDTVIRRIYEWSVLRGKYLHGKYKKIHGVRLSGNIFRKYNHCPSTKKMNSALLPYQRTLHRHQKSKIKHIGVGIPLWNTLSASITSQYTLSLYQQKLHKHGKIIKLHAIISIQPWNTNIKVNKQYRCSIHHRTKGGI